MAGGVHAYGYISATTLPSHSLNHIRKEAPESARFQIWQDWSNQNYRAKEIE